MARRKRELNHRVSEDGTGRAHESAARDSRWAVILAGGDGTRLRSLTRFICGDNRPKQFCALFEGGTLLGHTVRRAERSIPASQILFALTHTHRDFYVQELDGFQAQRIVQPANKGTAPPILFSALSIARMDEDALMAVLPSDHYYSDEACFTAALESAFEIAANRPESVVLIGAQPSRPEVEYGWIELGAPIGNDGELCRVRGFLEKPSFEVAETLLGEHSAWNTFVMVGRVSAFLAMVAQAIPDVLEALRRARVWNGSETHIEESVYHQVISSDFSKQVLSVGAARLLVLRVRDLGWSDLGHPERVLAALEEGSSQPWWTEAWKGKQTAVGARPDAESAVA
jgi:mannose-1-phosphate guanylyltransferase